MGATPARERFWRFVRMQQECWPWLGATQKGYPAIGGDYDPRKKLKVLRAARLSVEIHTGSRVPKELDVDHLCCNPICVRPDHLEAVTTQENLRRAVERGRNPNANKTHCHRGHEFTPENTIRRDTGRWCKACRRDYMRVYKPIWRATRIRNGLPRN